MTVKDLREELENYPEGWEVVMWGNAEQGEFQNGDDYSAPVVGIIKSQKDGKTRVVLE